MFYPKLYWGWSRMGEEHVMEPKQLLVPLCVQSKVIIILRKEKTK